jgi:polysaccharide biosynthesis transport protein
VGSGLQLRSESLSPFINPVYEILDEQIALSRTKLAGLERQQAQLVSVLKLNAPQVAQLAQLYGKERELARLETEFDLAKKVYVEVSTRYEQARLQVVSHTAQLQLLDSALPPDAPISPRPLRAVAIALTIGLLVSMLGVWLLDFVATSRLQAEKGS